MDATALLGRLTARQDLTRAETADLFDAIMAGTVEPVLLASILAALATKGETVAELVGAAEAMRRRVTRVPLPTATAALDTCGTGGDGKPLFNVSTTVAIVAAAAGATVAKHGNRSNARPSGSAECLMALGIDIEADVSVVQHCLRTCRVAFLYAPRWHPAMQYAAPVRRSLGVRTIFNLVGPLTNPAGVRRQLVGVHRPGLTTAMAEALRLLGAERAMVVHGLDGLCDLSISAPSRIARLDAGTESVQEIDCRIIGATPGKLEELFVHSPQESAAVIEGVLAGRPGPAREMVVFNTAAALWVAGLADGWQDGARVARHAIDGGAAAQTLAAWRAAACRQPGATLSTDAHDRK